MCGVVEDAAINAISLFLQQRYVRMRPFFLSFFQYITSPKGEPEQNRNSSPEEEETESNHRIPTTKNEARPTVGVAETTLQQYNQKILILTDERDEALRRLSELVSVQMRTNNPNIVDLNDPFRPTKLAEISSEIYDNEWTEAFDRLEDEDIHETERIRILLDVVMVAYGVCQDEAEREWDTVNKWHFGQLEGPEVDKTRLWLKESRKSLVKNLNTKMAEKTLDCLKWYVDCCLQQLLITEGPVRTYLDACVSLCLHMVVQDPPVGWYCPGWTSRGEKGEDQVADMTNGLEDSKDTDVNNRVEPKIKPPAVNMKHDVATEAVAEIEDTDIAKGNEEHLVSIFDHDSENEDKYLDANDYAASDQGKHNEGIEYDNDFDQESTESDTPNFLIEQCLQVTADHKEERVEHAVSGMGVHDVDEHYNQTGIRDAFQETAENNTETADSIPEDLFQKQDNKNFQIPADTQNDNEYADESADGLHKELLSANGDGLTDVTQESATTGKQLEILDQSLELENSQSAREATSGKVEQCLQISVDHEENRTEHATCGMEVNDIDERSKQTGIRDAFQEMAGNSTEIEDSIKEDLTQEQEKENDKIPADNQDDNELTDKSADGFHEELLRANGHGLVDVPKEYGTNENQFEIMDQPLEPEGSQAARESPSGKEELDGEQTSKVPFEKSFFREYMKRGNYIDFIVWPAMRSFEGYTVSKGVAQCCA